VLGAKVAAISKPATVNRVLIKDLLLIGLASHLQSKLAGDSSRNPEVGRKSCAAELSKRDTELETLVWSGGDQTKCDIENT
jgi:hypothetical protein